MRVKEINFNDLVISDWLFLLEHLEALRVANTYNNIYYELTYAPTINHFLEILKFFILKGYTQPIINFETFKNEYLPPLPFNNLFDFLKDLISKSNNQKILKNAYLIIEIGEYYLQSENEKKQKNLRKALSLNFSLIQLDKNYENKQRY